MWLILHFRHSFKQQKVSILKKEDVFEVKLDISALNFDKTLLWLARVNLSSPVVADLSGQFVPIIQANLTYLSLNITTPNHSKASFDRPPAKPKTVTVYHLSPDMPPEQLQR